MSKIITSRIIEKSFTDDNTVVITRRKEIETTDEYELVRKIPVHEVEPLTPAELDILELIVKGYTAPEIARLRGNYSPRSVETHRQNIRLKLQLTERWQLVEYYFSNFGTVVYYSEVSQHEKSNQ